MMIWNKMSFYFPSNYMMEQVKMFMDYTVMILIFIFISTMLLLMNNMFMKEMNYTMMENHELELLWSMIPFIILIFMGLPSILLLYMLESCNFCGLNMKIIGHQWYWSYFFLDLDKYFMSYMNQYSNYIRLLESDNSIMMPINIPIRLLVSSVDVIHSWTIPSMSIKVDAIPGRINMICFCSTKIGKFFGQCSEICGANHSFMPISIEIINLKDYLKI